MKIYVNDTFSISFETTGRWLMKVKQRSGRGRKQTSTGAVLLGTIRNILIYQILKREQRLQF